MGCEESNRSSKTSAGGHVEQPSEVNNSTRIGTGLAAGGVSAANIFVPMAAIAIKIARLFIVTSFHFQFTRAAGF
jgi:hypothetical protein